MLRQLVDLGLFELDTEPLDARTKRFGVNFDDVQLDQLTKHPANAG